MGHPLGGALDALRAARERLDLAAEEVERDLLLGPGWMEAIEGGRITPDLSLFALVCQRLGLRAGDLLNESETSLSPLSVSRSVRAEETRDGLRIEFQYAEHAATYELPAARQSEFERVVMELRDGLADARASKADAVVRSFNRAVSYWPSANPSDIWWFIIYRVFLDPFNHPASRHGGDHAQSWSRTSGWALERVFVEHYAPALAEHGIVMGIFPVEERRRLLATMRTEAPLNADKADVLLVGTKRGEEQCFGVVHVKASFAERRTDDEPMSRALIEAGYLSPLLTMDCKSTPGVAPLNRGELGSASGDRGDKRRDIEVSGIFSGCFSFNHRTEPTADPEARARIERCDFTTAEDAFSELVIERWRQVRG